MSWVATQNLRDLYRDLILEHARSPRHFGKLDPHTHKADGINRLCGDKLRIFLRIEDGQIEDVRFNGTGCAISVASASMLTEAILGMHVDHALVFCEHLIGRLVNPEADNDDFDSGNLRALEGVREYPSRIKCATLAWHALTAAIEGREAPASTE